MPDKKLLLVSYVFPPAGGITVQRALSLAKYLPGCGYEVHVLTAGNAAAPVQDPELLKQVPPEVTIHRSFTPEIPFHLRKRLWEWLSRSGAGPSRKAAPGPPADAPGLKTRLTQNVKRLLCPDPQVLWVPFAINRATQIIQKHKIDIVLVTAPPFSIFLIGNTLKRRFPHLKLVSDFRDEWLRFYLTDFDFLSGDHTRRRAEAIERATIELSDLVIAVTRSSLAEIGGRYPEQPGGKFACIPNGYDPEVFAGLSPRRHGLPRVVITHLGTAYKTSSPTYYLDALDAMPEQIRSQFETRFIGRIAETELPVLESRLSPVRTYGFLPQAEALRHAQETDYLLLTMTNDFSLPGKLFEYLAMGKPILALSPPSGEVAGILEETRAGWCADHNNPAAIQAMLRRALEAARDKRSFEPDLQVIRRYQRRCLTEQFDAEIRGLFRESFSSAP